MSPERWAPDELSLRDLGPSTPLVDDADSDAEITPTLEMVDFELKELACPSRTQESRAGQLPSLVSEVFLAVRQSGVSRRQRTPTRRVTTESV